MSYMYFLCVIMELLLSGTFRHAENLLKHE